MRKIYSLALACLLSFVGILTANAQVYKSVDPEPGTIVSSLRAVMLTFADDAVADFGSQYKNVTVTGENYSASCVLAYGVNPNQINVTFSEITENGDYTVNFPDDAITVDGVAVAAFTLSYTVGEDIEGTSTMIPAPGDVKWLYELVYTNEAIDKNLSIEFGVKATVTSPSGAVEDLNAVYDWQIGEGKYRFQLQRLATELGEYTVNIPGNLLYYNNDNWEKVYVPECTFKYTVTGGELTKVEGNPSIDNPTTLFDRFELTFPGYTTIETNSTQNVSIWREGAEYSVTSFSFESGVSVEGNVLKYQNNYGSYTDPGIYYMTFPEGCILLGEDKEPCTPFVYEFKVVEPEPVEMVFTPANGSEVSMLYHVTVNFPEIEKVELSNNPGASLQYVREDGTSYQVGGAYGANGFKQIDDNTWDIVFTGMATADGEYIMVLNKNSLKYEGGYNLETTLTYNFKAPETVDPTLDPADGAALDKIQNFTISFPDEAVVTLNPYTSAKNIDLYAGAELEDNGWGGYTNSKIGSASTFIPVEGTPNAFSFSLSAAALDKGEYLLVIPAGLFLIGEDNHTFSSAAQLHYSATGEGLDKIVVTPGEAVNTLNELTITYVNEKEIYLQNEWVGFSFYQEIEGQSWGTYLEYPSASNGGVSVEGNQLKIKLEKDYTEDGRYYIDITAYSLFMSDGTTPSTPQRVYWTVDSTVGIEDVTVAPVADGRIYTITGIEVKDMSKPGLYIVNGKKVLVK